MAAGKASLSSDIGRVRSAVGKAPLSSAVDAVALQKWNCSSAGLYSMRLMHGGLIPPSNLVFEPSRKVTSIPYGLFLRF